MKMSTLLVGLTGVVLFAVYVLVWINRASPTVVNAALPAAATLLSAIVLVFMLNRPQPISRAFPVVFVVEKARLLPVIIPDRPFPFDSLSLADAMRHVDPKIFEPAQGQGALDLILSLYHEYLQKMFVDDLASKQFGTWRMKAERFVDLMMFGPMSDSPSYRSKTITVDELERIFGKNRFARVHAGIGTWALPPDTELQIELPRMDSRLGVIGTIRLKNRLCEITIQTDQSFIGVGLGKYTPLVGLLIDKAQQEYFTVQYITRINVSFPWYRIGDPDMVPYREWANAIVEELSFSFDEDSIWSRTKDNFLLRRHFESVYPRVPFGPILMTPPPAQKQAESKSSAK
jgi:hypothetical protein